MWSLDYDGALLLRMPEGETERFLFSPFCKINLKRYIFSNSPGFIRFRPELNYNTYKIIISKLEGEASRQGKEFIVSSRVDEYIKDREISIEVRSRLGIEIKNHDSKLIPAFETFKQVVDEAMVRPLRDRQMWDAFYMYTMQKSANFSVPGSGKTSALLGMYAFMKNRGEVDRILVVCPKNAFGSWMDEFEATFGNKEPLHLLSIHDKDFRNHEQVRSALMVDSGKANLILVNYESVKSYYDALRSFVRERTLLVYDEVHKVKNVKGKRAQYAVGLSEGVKHTVVMTGTPIPNSYADIYNLLHILFADEYNDYFNYSSGELREPTPALVEEINDKIHPFFCRTTKQQLGVPDANGNILLPISASSLENEILHILKLKYRNGVLGLLVRILQLETNPQLLKSKLKPEDFKYLIDDSDFDEEIDITDCSEEIGSLLDSYTGVTQKFAECVSLTSRLVSEGKTVVIWCMFLDSIRNLSRALRAEGIKVCEIHGAVSLDDRKTILDDFKSGVYQVLVTNPNTLAESVSLHQVCHDAIYFEYGYNLVHMLQSKDRIHRLGLAPDQYTQYYYFMVNYDVPDKYNSSEIIDWSMEGKVYERLCDKEKIMLDAIDRDVLESMPTTAEELDMIFDALF